MKNFNFSNKKKIEKPNERQSTHTNEYYILNFFVLYVKYLVFFYFKVLLCILTCLL